MFKAGYVGLIGRPNAGKSTLLNALLGEKLAIVTRKPQTTRQRICGIHSSDNCQFVFLDAPGVVHAESGLNHFLEEEYQAVVQESDVLLVALNMDAKKKEQLEEIIDIAKASGKPWVAVITKSDMKLSHRLPWIKLQVNDHAKAIIEVSARNKPQLAQEALLPELEKHIPESPAPLYDPELYTTHNLREMAAETIREKCFDFLHEEIPYGLAVKINKYEEGDNLDRIYANIFLSKDAHKPMVIGQKGAKLKKIGQAARLDIEKASGKKVFLDMHVSVRKGWMKQNNWLKEFGYVHQ